MPLSEEAKRKIEEEEKLRIEIRKRVEKSPWWKPKGFGAWIVVLIFLALAFNLTSKSSTPTNNPLPPVETSKSQTIDENTSYTSKTEKGKTTYVILFKNPLARDDEIVGENIGKVIRYVYGPNTVSNPIPKIIERNGVNFISLEAANGGSFLILLMKNDNGTVWGMNLWKE